MNDRLRPVVRDALGELRASAPPGPIDLPSASPSDRPNRFRPMLAAACALLMVGTGAALVLWPQRQGSSVSTASESATSSSPTPDPTGGAATTSVPTSGDGQWDDLLTTVHYEPSDPRWVLTGAVLDSGDVVSEYRGPGGETTLGIRTGRSGAIAGADDLVDERRLDLSGAAITVRSYSGGLRQVAAWSGANGLTTVVDASNLTIDEMDSLLATLAPLQRSGVEALVEEALVQPTGSSE